MDFAFVLGAVPAGESSLFDDVSPEEFFDELNDLFASDPLGPLDELDAELQRLSDRAADDGDVARTKVVPPASPPLTFSPRDELAEVSMAPLEDEASPVLDVRGRAGQISRSCADEACP